jgi:hypothetical protein
LKFEKSTEILDDIINCQRSPFIKTGLGYDVVVASLPTLGLATTREVLFVASGVQTGLPEEKPTVDCAKQIDELFVPHMAEFEYTDDIVVNMSCSTPVSEPNPEPTSSDQPTQKIVPYHHPHYKNQRNGNHAFRSLQKRRERHNC